MHPTLTRLLSILTLEPLGDDRFAAVNEAGNGRLFGGQVIAQALRAASMTLPTGDQQSPAATRRAHSLHAYFLVGGEHAERVEYVVERLRDGGSFSVRRVSACQRGRVICSVDASFHHGESGLSHAEPMPAVPQPETLPASEALAPSAATEVDADVPSDLEWSRRIRPFEMRHVFVDGAQRAGTDRFVDPIWIRARGRVPDDDGLRRCLLAYASDMGVVSTGALPHGLRRERIRMASLDHALWLHEVPAFDDWILFVKQTTWGGAGRVLNGARFYSRAGRLLASCAQEGLMRVRGEGRAARPQSPATP